MRKVRQALLRSSERATAPHKPLPTRSRCTHRDAGAPSVGLLAPAFGQALPSLAGVPATYSYSENAGTLVDFCRALVDRDLGDASLWARTGKQPLRFAAATVKAAIERSCGDLLTRNVSYDLSIGDSLGNFRDEELQEGVLLISVDCNGCGYLKIGPALAAMEMEAEGLGAAFYHLLRLSLYRWLRLYDHTDAEAYAENLREWAEQEEEGPQGEYECPDVEGAMPGFLRGGDDKLHIRDYRAIVRKHRSGPFANWLQSLLKISALTRVPSRAPREVLEDVWDDAPLPVLLITFNDNDAIAAAFDAESQSMLEATHEPTFVEVFRPVDPVAVDLALRGFTRFLAINLELFTLVESLNRYQEGSPSADSSLDRQQS